MARKTANTSKSSDFIEAQIWGNMRLIDKSGVVHHFSRGIPLDTSDGRLERKLSSMPDGTEVQVILRVSHRGSKVEIDL